MKEYQRQIVSLGQRIGKSRWTILVLILIGITYFADFVSNVIKLFRDPGRQNPLNIFNIAGLLALSVAASLAAYVQIKSKEIKSRRIFLLIFVATGWGMLHPLMKIYPWNFVLAIMWVILGILLSRKFEWRSVESK